MLRDAVAADPLAAGVRWREAPRALDQDLLRVHTAAYLAGVKSGSLPKDHLRRIGLPWSEPMVERSLRSCGATVAAARAVVGGAPEGAALYLAGGTHHAGPERGEGFCVFNDVAVAARAIQQPEGGGVGQVMVIDTDVHQGNGTAEVFGADPSVFTFSIHGARNFPRIKVPGDLDIGLPDGAGDQEYLAALQDGLALCFQRCRPEFVFFVAGADPLAGDRFGRLALTLEGIATRDLMVLQACQRRDLPLVAVMAGGYGKDLSRTVASYLSTAKAVLRYRAAPVSLA